MLKEGEKIDKASLMKDVVAERLKEQAELERKLARLAKTLDHVERARREEEAPYIEEVGARGGAGRGGAGAAGR
jgi:translation initiation factor 3 subunit A